MPDRPGILSVVVLHSKHDNARIAKAPLSLEFVRVSQANVAPMLILTRRSGESVRIGDEIEISVLSVHGGQVRLGIKAPREIVVDREEIALRKQRERDQLVAVGAGK